MQTSEYAVAYAVSALGNKFQEGSKDMEVTNMFLAAAKQLNFSKGLDPSAVDRFIKDEQDGFVFVRSKFGNSLATIASDARYLMGEILDLLFSKPRGYSEIPTDMREKVDNLHALLGLAPGGTLLNANHPVCKEYPPHPTGATPRVFIMKKLRASELLFSKQSDANSATRQFLTALGG
jgi:hypothetical protein